MKIRIEHNLDSIQQQIDEVFRRGEDPSPIYNEIASDFLARVDIGFRRGESPGGTKWRGLSEVTMRRRRGTTAQILRDTGILKNSFSHTLNGKQGFTIGSDRVYAKTHQFGAKKAQYGLATVRRRLKSGALSKPYQQAIPWGDIPARPMLPIRTNGAAYLPKKWEAALVKIALRYLSK